MSALIVALLFMFISVFYFGFRLLFIYLGFNDYISKHCEKSEKPDLEWCLYNRWWVWDERRLVEEWGKDKKK